MKCIVTFSSGRYNEQVKHLKAGAEKWMPEFDFIHKSAEVDGWLGASHEELPYSFKLDMIDFALKEGYKTIVWLDSSIKIEGYPQEALEHAEEYGVATWENPNPLEKFTNDSTIEALKIKSFEGMKQVMAGCQVWNFNHDLACGAAIDLYLLRDLFANDNTTREGFVAHRHDQTLLSIVLHDWQIPVLPYGGMAYPDDYTIDGKKYTKTKDSYFIPDLW